MLAGTSNRPAEQSYDVVITNGRVMDPESGLDANRNIGLRAGKIAAISEKQAALRALLARWELQRTRDLSALNDSLRGAGLPTIP